MTALSTQEADRMMAIRILTHYFEVAFRAAGRQWDSDNQAEIEEAVDSILSAAKFMAVNATREA